MRFRQFYQRCCETCGRAGALGLVGVALLVGGRLQGQTSTKLLASRSELAAAAKAADSIFTSGDQSQRAQGAMAAAAIRQRLRDGDFQVGDRIVVTITSDAIHRDTVVVRSGLVVELPGMILVSVAGVLRSELQERVASEVRKYVKAQEVTVIPLMRVGILGAVGRPGYFALASDIPITDAIMSAGGPTPTADLQRTIVRRQNQQYRSADQTGKAIAGGLTLDQFGLSAGDELIVGQRRDFGAGSILGAAGALASVLALFVAMRR